MSSLKPEARGASCACASQSGAGAQAPGRAQPSLLSVRAPVCPPRFLPESFQVPPQVGIVSFGTDLPDTVSEEELLKVRGSRLQGRPAGRAGVATQSASIARCSLRAAAAAPTLLFPSPHIARCLASLHYLLLTMRGVLFRPGSGFTTS